MTSIPNRAMDHDPGPVHPGDELQTPNGTTHILTIRLYHTTETTYDLTINGLHTYYVIAGNSPVLVHNCGNGNLQSGNSPAASQGTSIHNGPEWGEHLDSLDYSRGRPLASGDVPDGFTDNGFPVELKPDTRSGIRAATRQLRRYMDQMGVDYGELWTYKVGSSGTSRSASRRCQRVRSDG